MASLTASATTPSSELARRNKFADVPSSECVDVPFASSGKAHKLNTPWSFWFLKRGQRAADYLKSLRKLGTAATVEDFWAVYSHIRRADKLPTTSDLHVFRGGISPTWEDEANKKGGKWIIRVRKGVAHRYWETLLLAMVGEQFENDICGAVLSVRYNEDIISLWNRHSSDHEALGRIREKMRQVLQLPLSVSTMMEYKQHDGGNQGSSGRGGHGGHGQDHGGGERQGRYGHGHGHRDHHGGGRGFGGRQGGYHRNDNHYGHRDYHQYNNRYNNNNNGPGGDMQGGGAYGGGGGNRGHRVQRYDNSHGQVNDGVGFMPAYAGGGGGGGFDGGYGGGRGGGKGHPRGGRGFRGHSRHDANNRHRHSGDSNDGGFGSDGGRGGGRGGGYNRGGRGFSAGSNSGGGNPMGGGDSTAPSLAPPANAWGVGGGSGGGGSGGSILGGVGLGGGDGGPGAWNSNDASGNRWR